jgi:tRNA dimethylallyltransferase
MGPTASGKTDAALDLHDRIPAEIISVDSAMVYRGMDIGTAKPNADVLQQYPHHLVDILDPADSYSAGKFRRDALALICDIVARGKIPILAGGTMLYYRVLQQGIANLPEADPDIRQRIDQCADEEGWPAQHEKLKAIDATAASRISPNDAQRIQRALEVYEITGRCLTDLQKNTNDSVSSIRWVKAALAPESRDELKTRIRERFERMIEHGFIDEISSLHQRDELHAALPSIRAVGYRQLWSWLDGEIDFEEAKRRAVIATGRLAKRQMTWLRAEPDVRWFDSLEPGRNAHIYEYVRAELAKD